MLARTLATFFGTGRAPRAPGTVATVASALPLLLPIPPGVYPWLLGGAAVLSFFLCVVVARRLFGPRVDLEDPSWFVLDEACGLWIAAWRPAGISWPALLLAVVLFRIFDITKPFPIRQSQDLRGGFGIVVDDALAGLLALAIGLCAERWLT